MNLGKTKTLILAVVLHFYFIDPLFLLNVHDTNLTEHGKRNTLEKWKQIWNLCFTLHIFYLLIMWYEHLVDVQCRTKGSDVITREIQRVESGDHLKKWGKKVCV